MLDFYQLVISHHIFLDFVREHEKGIPHFAIPKTTLDKKKFIHEDAVKIDSELENFIFGGALQARQSHDFIFLMDSKGEFSPVSDLVIKMGLHFPKISYQQDSGYVQGDEYRKIHTFLKQIKVSQVFLVTEVNKDEIVGLRLRDFPYLTENPETYEIYSKYYNTDNNSGEMKFCFSKKPKNQHITFGPFCLDVQKPLFPIVSLFNHVSPLQNRFYKEIFQLFKFPEGQYATQILRDQQVVTSVPYKNPHDVLQFEDKIKDLISGLNDVTYVPFERKETKGKSLYLAINQMEQGFYIFPYVKNQQKIHFETQLPSVFDKYIFPSIAGGISVFFTKTKIVSSHSVRREIELKILRHRGVSAYLVNSLMSIHLTGKHIEGDKFKELGDSLMALLKKTIQLALRSQKEVHNVYDYISLPFFNHVTQWMKDFLEALHQSPHLEFNPDIPEVRKDSIDEFLELFLDFNKELFSKDPNSLSTVSVPLYMIHSPKDKDDTVGLNYSSKELLNQGSEIFNKLNTQGLFIQTPKPVSHFQMWVRLSERHNGVLLFYNGKSVERVNGEEFRYDFYAATAGEGAGSNEESVVIKPTVGMNWFELNPTYYFKGEEISQSQARDLVEKGIIEFQGKIYVINKSEIPSSKALENFWQKLAPRPNSKNGKNGNDGDLEKQLKRHPTLDILALRMMGLKVDGDANWFRICEYFDHLGEPKNLVFKNDLIEEKILPYQRKGVQWYIDLYNLGIGGILADDMGLGKTYQTLSFLDKISEDIARPHVLIVVPTSLIYNWISEIKKFDFKFELETFTPQSFQESKSHFFITSYGMLTEHKEKFSSKKWDHVFFDEAQNLKNSTSQRYESALSIPSFYKWALTGTPLENNIGEFYNIMELVAQGALGERKDFFSEYVNATTIDFNRIQFLRMKVKPLILRRSKKQILSELPEKTEQEMHLDFDSEQKEIYKNISLTAQKNINLSISQNGEAKSQIQMLAALTRLRQVCSDPGGIPGVTYQKISPKIEECISMIEEIIAEGNSVLIFTQFLNTLHKLEKNLKKTNIPVLTLEGSFSNIKRREVLEKFNTDEAMVLAMTLKTGGVGLNLTKASFIFHIDPWWNPAVENQATDRAHRMGQTKNVSVYRFIMNESLEEKISVLKERKKNLFQSLFNQDEVESFEDINKFSSLETKEASLLTQDDFNFLIQTEGE